MLLDNETLHKYEGLRIVVGVTCFLSLFGSLLIILSYVLFKDLRTSARLILVHLSIADFGVAASNLFGEAYHFDRHFNSSLSLLTPSSLDRLCKAQAFVAHYCTISSVLWTMALAAFMYTVVTKLNSSMVFGDKGFTRFCYLFCYGMSAIVSIWMICTQRLGFSPYDTAGWCGSIIHKVELKESKIDHMAAVFGYDVWIVLTFVFIIVTYLSLHFYMREERKKSADFGELVRNIDYKFIIIPVAFVLLRMGSLVQNVISVYAKIPIHHGLRHFIHYIAGIGDSGQGAVNAVLFVIFTHSVRRKIVALCCCCCIRLRGSSQSRKKLTNRPEIESEESTDDSFSKSSPVKIAQKPQTFKKNKNMGSMVSTTATTPSHYDSVSSYES